jgi:hypothetical protein
MTAFTQGVVEGGGAEVVAAVRAMVLTVGAMVLTEADDCFDGVQRSLFWP